MENEKLVDLLRIGLTEGEAKIYVALLELGPSSVGPIKKRTRISHSNIYEILERLTAKGIVTTIIKSGVKNFQAVSPGNLTQYLDQKENEIKKQREILKKALPRIKELQEVHPKQEAMLFVGFRGLRTAYEELYKNSGMENLWIYVHEDKYAKISDKFYLQVWPKIQKNIKSRGIVNESYRRSKFAKQFQKKHELRFVDFPIFSHGEVYGDKFMIVSWEDPIITVVVHARQVSEHFRNYFESVWNAGKK